MAWEEAPLRMDDSKVEIAEDYTKRKCVFRLKTLSGSECLFQVANYICSVLTLAFLYDRSYY